jgi:hypothetical protein
VRRKLHRWGMFSLESGMNIRTLSRSVFATCIALSACSGGGGSGGGGTPPISGAPPIISFSHIFPQGDATAASGTAWDIVGVKTTLSGEAGDDAGQLYDTLRVDVTFAQDVSNALPALGAFLNSGSELGVGIALNTDDNAATGAFDTCNVTSQVTPFEYVIDPGQRYGRLADGNYTIASVGGPIYTGAPNPPEEALTTLAGHVFTQIFFLPALHVTGASSIPSIGIDVAALNGVAGVTDCVPLGNGEIYTNHE